MRTLHHLQGLRAIAAAGVVVDHAADLLIRRGALAASFRPTVWLFGWLGVAIFFVISGLIMVRTSWHTFGTPRAASGFMLRRILRIVPPYWAYTAIYAALLAARGQAPSPNEIAGSLAFFPYFSLESGSIRPIVHQGWTLDFEMMFYVLFSISLLLRRPVGLALTAGLLVALVLAGTALRPLVPYADPVTPFQFWTDPFILLFLAGIGLGIVEARGRRPTVAAPLPLLSALIVAGAAIACFAALDGRFPLPIVVQALLALAATACVALCTFGQERPSGMWSRIAERAGDASFSTYLIHPLILSALASLWVRLTGGLGPPLAFIATAVVLANLGGLVSYRLLEQPLLRLSRGLRR